MKCHCSLWALFPFSFPRPTPLPLFFSAAVGLLPSGPWPPNHPYSPSLPPVGARARHVLDECRAASRLTPLAPSRAASPLPSLARPSASVARRAPVASYSASSRAAVPSLSAACRRHAAPYKRGRALSPLATSRSLSPGRVSPPCRFLRRQLSATAFRPPLLPAAHAARHAEPASKEEETSQPREWARLLSLLLTAVGPIRCQLKRNIPTEYSSPLN